MTEWTDKVNWGGVPEYMRAGVARYVVRGVPPGHFLKALFCNDFMEMGRRADGENGRALMEYAKLLYNHLPAGSFGSESNYREWVLRGGLNGNDKHEPMAMHKWSRFADQEYRE